MSPPAPRFRFLEEVGAGGLSSHHLVCRGDLSSPWLGFAEVSMMMRHNARLTRETEIALKLLEPPHPNLMRFHGLFLPEAAQPTPADAPFVVADFITGDPLADLAQPGRDTLRWPPQIAAALIQQAATGLAQVAQRGLLHAWLNPNKLFLTPLGVLKVLGLEIPPTRDTDSGMMAPILGNPRYISPEQINGAALQPASSVFTLGTILYELLTGHHPFEGDTPIATMFRVLNEEVTPPTRIAADVSEGLGRVVVKALARELPERFEGPGELAQALATEVGPPQRIAVLEYGLNETLAWIREELHEGRAERVSSLLDLRPELLGEQALTGYVWHHVRGAVLERLRTDVALPRHLQLLALRLREASDDMIDLLKARGATLEPTGDLPLTSGVRMAAHIVRRHSP